MKKSLILAGLLLVSTSGLMASDSGFYVGIDIGNNDFNIESKTPGYIVEVSDAGSQTLKIGYCLDKNNRAAIFYQHTNGSSSGIYGAGYDYLIGKNNLKPFVGVLAGYGDIVSQKGNFYGVQAGLNYAFNDNFSAEIGYRYLKANMDDTVIDTSVNPNVNVDMELDLIKNWFAGVNYKF